MKQFLKIFFGSFLGSAFGVIVGALFLITLAITSVSMFFEGRNNTGIQGLKNNSILVLDLAQNITDLLNESFLETQGGGYNLHDIRKTLEEASGDDRVQGILIKMTSATPIGWSMAKELRKILLDFSESKKSIIAFGEVVDEKSIYIASVAKNIYMHLTGEVNWDGFAITPVFYKGLFDKLELEPIIFKAGRFKSAIEPFTKQKMSFESRQQTEELLEDLWEEALEVISISRNVDVNNLREFAENATVRTAKEAEKIDLIDDVIRYTDLVEMLLQEKETSVKESDLKRIVSIREYEALKEESMFAALEQGSLFNRQEKKANTIGVLVLEGAIVQGSSEKGIIGSDSVVRQLQKIRLDEKIKGVVLRVNSPGGSALASNVIWHEIEKLKTKKPVYVSMGDVAASGGYYIAAGANKIFANINTITGSIGVFSVLFNIQKTFRHKLGLTFDRVVTNKYADLGSSMRAMGENEKAIFQKDIGRVYKSFLSVVEKGRGYTKLSDVKMVAQGRVWSGVQAKEVGLVDELGGLEDCVVALAGELKLEDYDLDFYPKKKAFQGLLNDFLSVGVKLQNAYETLSSPMEYTRKIKERFGNEQILMLSPYTMTIN